MTKEEKLKQAIRLKGIAEKYLRFYPNDPTFKKVTQITGILHTRADPYGQSFYEINDESYILQLLKAWSEDAVEKDEFISTLGASKMQQEFNDSMAVLKEDNPSIIDDLLSSNSLEIQDQELHGVRVTDALADLNANTIDKTRFLEDIGYRYGVFWIMNHFLGMTSDRITEILSPTDGQEDD